MSEVPPSLEFLTKKDLAAFIKVSNRQIENLVKAGRLPKPLRIGTHPRWRLSELLKFLDDLSGGANPT